MRYNRRASRAAEMTARNERSYVHPSAGGIEAGDPHAAEQLLPLVYDELRKLAAQELAQEKPGQTLQATALVHEAYLRLVRGDKDQYWDSRRHFFAAAAEAMRRILIDQYRHILSAKGGGLLSASVPTRATFLAPEGTPAVDLLALDEALKQLEAEDPVKARAGQTSFLLGRLAGGCRRHARHLPRHGQALLGLRPLLALRQAARGMNGASPSFFWFFRPS